MENKMKFEFIDEPEEKPKKKKIKIVNKEKEAKQKANIEAYESWNKFVEIFVPTYEYKIKTMNNYELINELIIVMDSFSKFGLSYDNFEAVLKHQMDRAGWMIHQVRKCCMLQKQAEILKKEIEYRKYYQVLELIANPNEKFMESVTEKIKYWQIALNHFEEVIDKMPLNKRAICEECNESKKLLKDALSELNLLIMILLYKGKENEEKTN